MQPTIGPRERLLRNGPDRLADHELVALLLGSGCSGHPVTEVARRLTCHGLAHLERCSLAELRTTPGLGPARAAALKAALELGRRLNGPPGPGLTGPEEALVLLADMAALPKEHFRALYLDSRRRLLRQETISVGTLTASLVHPREVFAPALELRAAAVLVAHNHPSGDPSPSSEDLALTRRLRQSGEILGIELVDHLIVARSGCVSLKQRGEL